MVCRLFVFAIFLVSPWQLRAQNQPGSSAEMGFGYGAEAPRARVAPDSVIVDTGDKGKLNEIAALMRDDTTLRYAVYAP